MLDNNKKLKDCGVFDESVLQLVEQPVKTKFMYQKAS